MKTDEVVPMGGLTIGTQGNHVVMTFSQGERQIVVPLSVADVKWVIGLLESSVTYLPDEGSGPVMNWTQHREWGVETSVHYHREDVEAGEWKAYVCRRLDGGFYWTVYAPKRGVYGAALTQPEAKQCVEAAFRLKDELFSS